MPRDSANSRIGTAPIGSEVLPPDSRRTTHGTCVEGAQQLVPGPGWGKPVATSPRRHGRFLLKNSQTVADFGRRKTSSRPSRHVPGVEGPVGRTWSIPGQEGSEGRRIGSGSIVLDGVKVVKGGAVDKWGRRAYGGGVGRLGHPVAALSPDNAPAPGPNVLCRAIRRGRGAGAS